MVLAIILMINATRSITHEPSLISRKDAKIAEKPRNN
jgi:hypothetical protein